jgi:tetratricopeptide (TPR) repeat protein
MSEIKKYQKAMNFKANPRYLTRDFIVPLYTGTEPDILDDSNTQRESSVYKQFPNEMPIVSPKEIQNQPYEQLQLADGGRANFSEGSKLTGTDKTLEENIKSDHKAFNDYRKSIGQSTIPLDNEYIRMWIRTRLNEGGRVSFKKGGKVIENDYLFNFMKENSGISYLEKAKKLNKLGFTNSRGNKITDGLLEKFVTQNPELKGLGARSASFTLDEVKQYARPKQLQDFESGLIDEETFRTRVNQYRGDLKKTPEQKELYRKINYERMKADPEKKAKVRERQLVYNEKRYLEKGMYPPSKNPKDALWRDLLRSADVDDRVSLVGKRPNKYPRDVFQSIKLKDNETGKIISYKNLDKHPEYNKAIKPYQIKFAINQSELSPETRKKITYQRAEGGNKSNIVIQHNQGLGKNPFNTSLAIQGENIQESLIRDRLEKRFNAAKTLSDKKQAINLFKKELENKAPNIVSQPGKKAYGVETDVEGLLKTSKVPAGERRRLVQMIGSIGCPTYAIGGRVNFSEGTDCYNKGLKALEEGNLTKAQLNVAGRTIAESGDEGMLLKNLLSKAGTGFKFTGKGIGELVSIGGGPAGVIAGAALETAFAAPYLLEGDYKQALRQSIFGQVPEFLGVDIGSRDEDIIKLAKDAGVNPDSVKKYVELKKNYIENEEYGQKLNMLDEMYKRDPKNLDYVQQIRRLENKIKPSSDYLEKNVYAPKDLDKYEKDYLKAAKYFVDKNADRALLTRSEEQKKSSLRDIAQESLSAVRPEQDVENILREEKLLPQEPETQPQEELPDYYKISAADGGRIGLSGGGGPKIGRRGFLGLLAAGAAAAPEIMKGLKGEKKAVQAAKVISKINFEKPKGMYPWFPDLVEKIKTKGKPFEEKDLIMEASYKHEAKGYGGLPTGEEKLTKHVDGDTEFILREYPDGRIAVDIHSPRNQESFETPVTLYYRPTMELQYKSGVKVEPAEFKVLEKEPRYFANGPDDVDIELSETKKVPGKDTIFGDVEAAERFATGKIENRKIIPAKQARRDQMLDQPVDFIEETAPYGPVYD